jgi:hypothetical protein
VNVITTGWYRLSSNSTINTYGYIYKDNFNPLNPLDNLLLKDDDKCGRSQFGLRVDLKANTVYILVVTTVLPNVIGPFSIHASGPSNVTLKPKGNSFYLLVDLPNQP